MFGVADGAVPWRRAGAQIPVTDDNPAREALADPAQAKVAAHQ